MNPLIENIREAVSFVQSKLSFAPLTGIITGTGLGDAVGPLEGAVTLDYGDIPHFPVSTVVSHSGRLMAGTLAGHPLVVMQGRFHLYEGYTPVQVTFPVRVMQALGVRDLILSNAAGGMNPAFSQGDLMVIRDHINLTGENPLIGPNPDTWGPRFPDMTAAYDLSLIKRCRRAADRLGIVLKSGVYAGLKGPSLETPAEIRFLKTIGADAVGLSTVMETIAAVHAGMRVLGISTITNINDPDRPQPASVEAIVAVANQAAPHLKRLIERVVAEIHGGAAL
ncbi:purine-nucleoside phosphorylase [Desulfosarcina ovata]|uniref:Purine nucleoside phosphorylase n=1 Tax=Desulfosarcina ovata subsp. ovata TaxID=2752305 RepID=A0A5K8AEU5_9BACT|nr:purine-nucleoside phosphorylase [Desulfosarcina ovata]BBO91223.1 purine nucleoside phosphorylase [Desulfosarcina ovata subsp. ovata]